jgi:DNA-binding CsgD family transcriptional regulator
MTSEVRAAPAGWLLLRPGALAAHLQSRATTMEVVALTEGEVHSLTTTGSLGTAADADAELRLLELVAAGATKSEIGRALALSARTVDRRLRALRERFGAATYPELAAILAREGFGR